jgi:hypothetical protein
MLNTKVFFWVDPKRLTDLRRARAYRTHRQLVLTVDSKGLIGACGDRIVLSDRNTGTTSPFAHARGRETFLPLYQNGHRRIVELAVEGGIPDIRRYVIRALEIGGNEPESILYAKGGRL